MTYIGAGFRLSTGRSVPAEFAHAHLTENLALDPANAPSHRAWFNDTSSRPGTWTINICIDHPTFGVMVLGSLTLDDEADDETWPDPADGQGGAGPDHEYGAYDHEAALRPADEYLEEFIENSRRHTEEMAGPRAHSGQILNSRWQTFTEPTPNVLIVLNDCDHLSILKAVLETPDRATVNDYILGPRNLSIRPVELAAFRSSNQDNASARGEQPDAVSRVSWLQRMGETLNPIATAQAAGPEEDETRGLAEEFLDPLRDVRVQQYNSLMTRLREVDPGNRLLTTIQTHDYTPTDRDIAEVEEALNQALRRSDRPGAAPGFPAPPTLPSLSRRLPGEDPYDLALQAQREQFVIDYWRSQGVSEAEIKTRIEALRRSGDEEAPALTSNKLRTLRPPTEGKIVPETEWQLTGKLEDLEPHEQIVVEDLLRSGHKVRIVPTDRGRTPDIEIDGVPVEIKSIIKLKDASEETTYGALSNRMNEARSQAPNILIDAREQAGMTREAVERGFRRGFGKDRRDADEEGRPPKIQRVIIWTQNGVFDESRKEQ